MTNREYYDKCRAFSDEVGKNSRAAKELLENDPELSAEGAYEQYWKLYNAATTASLAWVDFCTNNKPSAR